MLKQRAIRTALLCILATCLAGCLTARERALEERMPQNHVFEPAKLLTGMGEKPLELINRSQTQAVCLLRVPREGKIRKIYHKATDVTLVVVEGMAAVEIEQVRYVAEQGDTIFLPRMTAYSIIPNDPELDFAAVVVYSPSYDPSDIHSED